MRRTAEVGKNSKLPEKSRSRAGNTVAGGYGTVAPMVSCRVTKVTCAPASINLSATEIASYEPVSSFPVHVVGDANGSRTIQVAVRDAALIARAV